MNPASSTTASSTTASSQIFDHCAQSNSLTKEVTAVASSRLRIKLRADLSTINREFEIHCGRNDLFIQRCREWHCDFTRHLKTEADEKVALTLYAERMQQILRDEKPAIRSPLEEDSYLGSDGYLYGRKALCFYVSALPKEYWGRSPVDPAKEDLFFVSDRPDPVVKMCFQWLNKQGQALPPHPAVEEAFAELERANSIPPLPTQKYMRARRIIQIVQSRATLSVTPRREVASENEDLHSTQLILQQAFEEQRACFASEQTRDEEALRVLEESRLSWRAKIQALMQRIEELEKKLQEADERITQAEKDTVRMELELRKTEKAIAERNAKGDASGFLSIACVIVSAVVTKCVLPEGTSAAVGPNGFGIEQFARF